MSTNKIQLKGSNSKAEYLSISNTFREEFLNINTHPELLEQSILVLHLIFHIISDLKEYIYFTKHYQGKENQQKLDLWNSEFVGSDRTEISRVYNISTFLKNRDKVAMKEALEFLKHFKNGEYSFENSKGKKITTSGGLITNWFFAEKSGNFEIIISQYWANKIVSVEYSNKFFTDVLYALKNNKQVFFYLWLLRFKEHQTDSGEILKMTTVKFETLKTVFKLKYKSTYDLFRFWLAPMKAKIELSKTDISFRYGINAKDNNKIDIVVFEQKPSMEIEDKDALISYKFSYLSRVYGLDNKNKAILKKWLESDYFDFINKYDTFKKMCAKSGSKGSKTEPKTPKVSAMKYKNDEFISKIQNLYSTSTK